MQTSPARVLTRVQDIDTCGRMVGRSSAMLEVYALIARAGPTEATVLITGESGTGKELVAEAIHGMSARRNAVLLPVNCAAVSSGLFESELFGHERGSFTGADRRRIGHLERAARGTLLLDELTEMPLDLQAKLLRVLETRTLLRVGSSQPVPLDVRIVATSNRDPRQAVREGRLREDLFYRVNVFPIDLPPLRCRGEDIPLLARHFLAELNRKADSGKRWGEGELKRLQDQPWPGNVRELRNVVQRAFILCETELHVETLGKGKAAAWDGGNHPAAQVKVGGSIAMAEQDLIVATLERMGGNKPRAAELLGISLKTLYSRINLYRARGIPLSEGSNARAD